VQANQSKASIDDLANLDDKIMGDRCRFNRRLGTKPNPGGKPTRRANKRLPVPTVHVGTTVAVAQRGHEQDLSAATSWFA
jgi:hypothetical protein